MENITKYVFEAGTAVAAPHFLTDDGRLRTFMLPPGYNLQEVDLSKHLPAPMRRSGTETLKTAQSFADWVKRYRTKDTIINVDRGNTVLTAIFNANPAGPSGAGWGDDVAVYACPLSDQWETWSEHSQDGGLPGDKRGMRHVDFVQFIEDNLLDITEPASGAMLTILRSFEAKKDVQFKSAVRLENGSIGFNYVETVQQVEGTGRLTMPDKFSITIPVFVGGMNYIVDANLRYRVHSGGLTMWYELVRPQVTLDHAFNKVIETIREEVNAGAEPADAIQFFE